MSYIGFASVSINACGSVNNVVIFRMTSWTFGHFIKLTAKELYNLK